MSGIRQLKSLGLALALSVLWAGSVQAESLFWRIEQGGMHVGWLFGTMHVDDARVIDLPQPVFDAVDDAEQFVLEIAFDPAMMTGMMGRMFYRDGTQLSDHLSDEEYEQLIALLQDRGMPEYSAKYMKLWAAYMTVVMPPPTTGQFVDLMLYQRALSGGADVHGLETLDEQLGLFESLPISQQRELLLTVLDDPEAVSQMMEDMKRVYIRNDLDGLAAMSEQQMGEMGPELTEWFEKAMVENRNRHMTERLIPILEASDSDKTFVAVGALHLPASHGLVNGLREAGYTLRPIDIRWAGQ